jgi:hypothetical protein
MTESFTNRLPPFTDDGLPMPPTEFHNLAVRVFPLRARMKALQQQCDYLLNNVSREAGYFRAAQPYVYLTVVDNNELPNTPDVTAMFYFLVERYEEINEKLVFRNWAFMAPDIQGKRFGGDLSRFLYPFSQIPSRIESTASGVVIETLSALHQHVGYDADATVEKVAPRSNFRFPFNPSDAAVPWNVAQRVVKAMAGFGQDATKLLQFMQAFETREQGSPRHVAHKLRRATEIFEQIGEARFIVDLVGEMKFRNAGQPLNICYQAHTVMTTEVTVNDSGLLGEDRVALGDLTGGYAVTLREKPEETERHFGLEVQRRWKEGCENFVALQPVMPFYMDLAVRKLKGATLAWRTGDGIWRDSDGMRVDRMQQPVVSTPFFTRMPPAVEAAFTGPFKFTGARVAVFPLPAIRGMLQEFLTKNFNDALSQTAPSKNGRKEDFRLSLWRSPRETERSDMAGDSNLAYIYIAAISLGKVTSQTLQLDDWAKYEVSILIPTQVESREQGGKWQIRERGLTPAFTLIDGSVAAVWRSDVLGIPTVVADFLLPGNDAGELLLNLRLQDAKDSRPLLEIRGAEDGSRGTKKPADRTRFLESGLRDEKEIIPFIRLKQFRDPADASKACYQSRVHLKWVLTNIIGPREIEEAVYVSLYDFPSLALPEKLGISPQVQAVRPFFFQATISEEVGNEFPMTNII